MLQSCALNFAHEAQAVVVMTSLSRTTSSDRRIALLKPAAVQDEKVTHAMQLLSSMLWAFKGATRSTWITAPLDTADVIVVHHDDRDERIPSWRASGRLIVEITTNVGADTAELHSLTYPFRAAQVHSLLERLDAELRRSLDTEDTSAHDDEAWHFVQALRNAPPVHDQDIWLVAMRANTPLLWIKGDRETYLAPAQTIQAIRQGSLKLSELTLEESSLAPQGLTARPESELRWFSAYHASPALAPWLNAAARYRITRWPNFASIRPHPAQIRVAAALAATPANVAQIASRAHVPKEDAIRTLNALAACAVVTLADAKPRNPEKSHWDAPKPAGGFTLFLKNMRKHLGLGA